MPEPCRGCPRRTIDFGGCRCQAFQLTGDATATDPVCYLSPHHGLVDRVVAATNRADEAPATGLVYRHIDHDRGRQPSALGKSSSWRSIAFPEP